MKAIILAAGRGSRLEKYTKNMPKGMLQFNGKSLIGRQVEVLRSCGIKKIVIVRGYMPDKIKIAGVKYCENKDYMSTNMVETLFAAEREMDDDLIVCYSDIIYQKSVIEKVMASNADIGVTADADYRDYWKARLDDPQTDTESLVIENGNIIELGDTNCGIEKAKVRYVGLIKFSRKGLEALKKVYHENKEKYYGKNEPWLRSKSFKMAYMTCMLQAIINAGYTIQPIIVQHGWLEFDTNEDFDKYNLWLKKGTLARFISLKN